MPWLPEGFEPPERLELPGGHHLRPIREDDLELDYLAVMGSRDRLWGIYGQAWGWPRATMTGDEDRAELAWHEDEMRRRSSYNYAIFDSAERELLGCVYIDPSQPDDGAAHAADAVVSWWVVDHVVGGVLDATLTETVPRWLAEVWPFATVHFAVV